MKQNDLSVQITFLNTRNTFLVKTELIDGLDTWDPQVIRSTVGEARKDPVDKFDAEIGFDLALGRALQALGRKIEKAANGVVRNHDHNRALKENLKPHLNIEDDEIIFVDKNLGLSFIRLGTVNQGAKV